MKEDTIQFALADWFDNSIAFMIKESDIDLEKPMGSNRWPQIIYDDIYPIESGQYVYMDTPDGKILLLNSSGMMTRIDQFDMETVIKAGKDFGLITSEQYDNKAEFYRFSLYIYCKSNPLIILEPNE